MALQVWLPLNKEINVIPAITEFTKESAITLTADSNGWYKVSDSSHTSSRWGIYKNFAVKANTQYTLYVYSKSTSGVTTGVGVASYESTTAWPTNVDTNATSTEKLTTYTWTSGSTHTIARVYLCMTATSTVANNYVFFKDPIILETPSNQGLADITITNYGATVDNNGKIGKCYSFNDNYLVGNSGPLNINTTEFSISCWVYFNNLNNYHCIYSQRTVTGEGITLWKNGNHIRFDDGSNMWETTYTLSASVWTHITVTRTSLYKKLYINGVLLNTTTSGVLKSISNKFLIGKSSSNNDTNNPNGNILLGKLNDLRIYDHCLSPKEVKEISLGLVLHYKLDSPYTENTTNLSTLGNCSGWNNSGTATRTNNDTSLSDIPEPSGKTVSILENTDGLCAITFGTTTVNVPSKTLTASVWIYISGDVTSSISPYIRSSKTDSNIGNLEYNSLPSIGSWPKNTWIRITKTFTTNSEATTVYFCAYIAKTGCKLTFNGWQIEEKDHTTPYVNGTRTENVIYDSSGYGNNGTITGTLSINSNTPRYNYSTYFIGNTNRANIPMPNINTFTYSFWFKRTRISLSNREMLMTGWYGVSFELNPNNTLTFKCSCTSSHTEFNVTSNTIFNNTNNWYFVTFTHTDGVGSKMYVNGILDVTRSFTELMSYTATTANIAYFSNALYFDGYISDFRIYATELSAEDILQLYQVNASIDNGGNIISNEFEEEYTSRQQVLKTGIVKIDNFLETNDKLKVLSDGSVFLLILHHNAPASNLFTSSNCWLNNGTNLYSALILLKNASWLLPDYEFLVCEKLESSSTESQIRWKLTSNPAVDTTPSGFLLISGSSSYLSPGLVANTGHGCFDMNGDSWWCCCGCYVAYQGGIPGFTGTVKTGYLDLYVKIPNEMIKGNIADFVKFYAKSILTNQLIEK